MVNCKDILSLFNDSFVTRLENSITKQHKYRITDTNTVDWLMSHHPGYTLAGAVIGFKYETGDYLDWHKDSMYSKKANLTGGVVLNDDFTGGAFELENGVYIDQTPGKVFTLGRNILHRVTKIQSGTRYSLHYNLLSEGTLI